jgi:hypothetical protein
MLPGAVFGDLSTQLRNYGNVSAADASRLAALLVAYISRYAALLAPCQAGASTPETSP